MEVTNAAPQGITVEQAAEKFKAFLNPKPPAPVTQEPENTQASEAPATATSEPPEETPPAQEKQTRKVRVDGEDLEVDDDELIRGYSRTADYTRKTQKLAEERKAHEAEAAAVRAERQQYAETLTALKAQLQTGSTPDLDRLLSEDPLEYVRQKAVHDRRKEQLAAIDSEQRRLVETQQAEQQKALKSHIEEEERKLTLSIPEWSDAKRAKADKDAIADYARSIGFSDTELSQLYDHRAVLALRDAARFRTMQAEAKKKVEAVKDSPKTAKPGNLQERIVDSDLAAAKERFAQTGSMKDAAAVFTRRLNQKR